MKKRAACSLWLLLFSLGFSAACRGADLAAPASTQAPVESLNVFAAASLTEAFTALAAQFEARHPGLTITFNFAGSQYLAQQISDGAPADVFASADQAQMEVAILSGRAAAGAVQVFARNRLVVIFPKDNPAGLAALADLAKPGLKLVLAAPEVPAGRYAVEFLHKARQDAALGAAFSDAVLQNVVSYEHNVKVVLTKIALGEADAGIVYTSDVTGEGALDVGQMEIPADLNVLAAYLLAVLQDSHNPAMAQAFVDFVLSPDGQAVLAQHGFLSGGEK